MFPDMFPPGTHQKRLADFMIRTCFHEAGSLKLSDPSSGPNLAGFCSRDNRRPEVKEEKAQTNSRRCP